eukprot:2792334-Pleurochrysis_carterae.AAC.4
MEILHALQIVTCHPSSMLPGQRAQSSVCVPAQTFRVLLFTCLKQFLMIHLIAKMSKFRHRYAWMGQIAAAANVSAQATELALLASRRWQRLSCGTRVSPK